MLSYFELCLVFIQGLEKFGIDSRKNSKLMMEERRATPMSTKISDSLGSLVFYSIELLSRISVGQTFLKLIDRILWVVEKSAQWSLPIQEMAEDENGKTFGEIELVRPLPWILFLPGLILLRAMRAGFNFGAAFMGYREVQASDMVKYLQKRRRQLRTIKNNGLKSMRSRKPLTSKDKGSAKSEAGKSLIRSIQLTLSTLFCLGGRRNSPSPPPIKIQVSNDCNTANAPSKETSATESATSPQRTDTKRKFYEITASSSDEDSNDSMQETLKSQIDRLASEDSNDDPDFIPDGDSTGGTTDTSLDDEVSITEAKELMEEADKDLPKLRELSEKLEIETTHDAVTEKKANTNISLENSGSRQGVEFSEGQESYYSPNNFGTEGELAFYSPISSKSVSPERSISPIKQTQLQGNAKSGDLGNGDLNNIEEPVVPENDISKVPTEEVTNGHVGEKKSTHSGKFNHKHRRTSHGNRKKK